jgi:hypothetical protein
MYQKWKGGGVGHPGHFLQKPTAQAWSVQVQAAFVMKYSLKPPLLDLPIPYNPSRQFAQIGKLAQDKSVSALTDRNGQNLPVRPLEPASQMCRHEDSSSKTTALNTSISVSWERQQSPGSPAL